MARALENNIERFTLEVDRDETDVAVRRQLGETRALISQARPS